MKKIEDREDTPIWVAFALVYAFKGQRPEVAAANADKMLAEYEARKHRYEYTYDEEGSPHKEEGGFRDED